MNEIDLSRRLGALVADQPTMRHTSANDPRRGRRRLRVRQALVATGAGVLASAVVAGALQLDAGSSEDGAGFAASPNARSSHAELLQRCTQVDNGASDPDAFGPGSRIVVSDRAAESTVLAVVADTAPVWALCQLSDYPESEFSGYAETYPLAAMPGESYETSGGAWGHGAWWYLDRFPAEVARVRLEFREGPTVTRRAVDGYVSFVVGDPRFTVAATVRDLQLAQTLYDADGNVLGVTGGWDRGEPEQNLPEPYQSLVTEPLDPSDLP